MVKTRFSNHLALNARNGNSQASAVLTHETAFGYPRDFLENKHVYLVLSPRANGLSIGLNLNPVVKCSFNCLYCEVDRNPPAGESKLDNYPMGMGFGEKPEPARGGGV